MPLLRGNADEVVQKDVSELATLSPSCLHALGPAGECVAISVPVDQSLAATTTELYRQLFHELDDARLLRVWSFIPEINTCTDGLENYQAFCVGRHEAFETQYGDSAKEAYSAASAVGVDDDRLTVIAMATRQVVSHGENPLQQPAYEYPRQYGPRPPSFKRASWTLDNEPAFYISGTASIRGSDSIAPSDLGQQLVVTEENLRLVLENSRMEPAQLSQGVCRAYVRHAQDASAVESWIRAQSWPGVSDYSILRSDICRSELLVEVELSWPALLD
ncbi:MAG: hypothetical protein AAFX93_16905 [Verrucomicrobiota bacterium]